MGQVRMHVPVMVREVLEVLEPCFSLGWIVDATVGTGGHTAAIVARMGQGAGCSKVIGMDVDPEALEIARERLGADGKRGVSVFLVRSNYVEMRRVVERLGAKPVSGVLFDLGVSSHQLAGERGFSFDRDGPLDMRFDPESRVTAAEVLRRATVEELREWLKVYGEERWSRRIARAIYERRRELSGTRDLREVIAGCVPGRGLRKTLARVFQALRIVVNNELDNVRRGLYEAVDVVAPGGRVAVICYQSGEDRAFKEVCRESADRVRVLRWRIGGRSRFAKRPGAEEVRMNPRARSARLRVLEKVR